MSKRLIILAGASLLSLGGCMQSDDQIRWSNREHTQILAQETTADLKIDTVASGEKLGTLEREAVAYFAGQYQHEGHGAVIISRPANGPNDITAMRAAADARAILLAEGVEPTQIAEGNYDATGAHAAPLIISYRTYAAVVPNCPDISHYDFAWTGSNSALPSLGCAVAINLAAQIANPGDLVGDHRMDPADATRRTVVLSKYREGQKTGAERNDDSSGAISQAVGK